MLLRDRGDEDHAAASRRVGTRDPHGEVSPVIWWEAGPSGFNTLLSAGWTALTGQSAAEGQGFGWTHCVHPQDHDRILATVHRAKAEQVGFRLEYRLRRKAGDYCWVADVGAPAHASGIYLGMVVDITAQRAREQAPRVATVAPELVSVPEAARILGVSAAHLYRLARDPIRPPFVTRLGRVVRIDLTQLRTYLRQR